MPAGIEVARLVVPLMADTSQFERELRNATSSTNKFASGLQAVGKVAIGAGLGALTAAVGGFAAVVKTTLPMARDFQSAVVDLDIAAGESGLSLAELHDAALAVGGDARLLGVSASGAAESMTGLYKAGLSTTEIFGDLQGYLDGTAELGGALRGAIDLAAASELDMVQASDLAAIALSTFGGELETDEERADFVTKALDNFVRAADASVADVTGLADALKNVGPVAAQFGFSIEDTNNALAVLSTRGIQGSEAGTALRSMLTNIMRPTDTVKDKLKALNVQLYDQEGALKPLPQIIGDFQQALYGANEVTTMVGGRTQEQNDLLAMAKKRFEAVSDRIRKHETGLLTLSDKALAKANDEYAASLSLIEELSAIQGTAVTSTKQLTEAERNEAIQVLAGTYGMRAFNTLLTEGVEGWDAMAMATANATGIQEQARRKAETLAGQWEAFQGNLETWAIQIGESVIPLTSQLVGIFQGLGEQYGPIVVAAFQEVGAALSGALAVLTSGQGVFAALVEILDNFLPEETIARIWELRDTIAPIVEQIAGWLSQNVDLQDVLIALGVAIATVVVPAVISLITTMGPILLVFAAVTAAVALLRTAWENNWGDIQGKTAAVVAWLKQAFEDVKAFIGSLDERWFAFRDNVILIWEAIRTYITETWTAVREFLTTTLETIASVFEWIWTGIKNTLIVITGLLLAVLFGRWEDAALILAAIWEAIKETATKVWTAIKETVAGIVKALGAWLKETAWPAIQQAAIAAWERIKTTVANKATELKESVVNLIRDIADFIKTTDWLAVGRSIIEGLVAGVKAAADKLVGAIKSVVDSAIKAAKRALGIQSPSAVFMEIGRLTMQGMGMGIAQTAHVPVTATAGAISSTINRTLNMTVNASYANAQSESDVARDVATQLQLLGWT